MFCSYALKTDGSVRRYALCSTMLDGAKKGMWLLYHIVLAGYSRHVVKMNRYERKHQQTKSLMTPGKANLGWSHLCDSADVSGGRWGETMCNMSMPEPGPALAMRSTSDYNSPDSLGRNTIGRIGTISSRHVFFWFTFAKI